jgi:hypothetical protein
MPRNSHLLARMIIAEHLLHTLFSAPGVFPNLYKGVEALLRSSNSPSKPLFLRQIRDLAQQFQSFYQRNVQSANLPTLIMPSLYNFLRFLHQGLINVGIQDPYQKLPILRDLDTVVRQFSTPNAA